MVLKITDQNLLQQAQDLRLEAHRLLYDECLVDLIRSVGPTRVIGSFTLDLMTWRDINISVEIPHDKDTTIFLT